jgi:1-acyl-sn-glycerol-3-phosphate acyltransferase
MSALRQARDWLEGGHLLGVAPEGTRSRTSSLLPAKTGAAYLADKMRVPVVPCAIWGTEHTFPTLFRLHRPHIWIEFGQPLHLPPVERRAREADLQRNTDEIMCHIAALLPESYWGVYKEHPRVRKIASARISHDQE